MRLGYNTNGFAFHRWQDTLEILAEIGYRSVALTVDQFLLNPYVETFGKEVDEVRRELDRLDMSCVIETGARFLLDSRRKHEPTLVSPDESGRYTRLEFLRRCVDLAAELNADAVSFWAGTVQAGVDRGVATQWLTDGCRKLVDMAENRQIRLAFEPEPGMLIETMEQYAELSESIDSERFGLTVDIGHLQCVEDEPIPSHLRRWSSQMFNIHIEDMCHGVHEHLRFGEGEIDFDGVMSTLTEIRYTGGVHVELSRHSHMAPQVAAESYHFLLDRMG